MNDLSKLVRPNILGLQPYTSARDEYTGSEGVFLDANENPFGHLNRYPDPYQQEVKEKLGEVKNIAPGNIFIGNGSDEVIDLAFRIFCEPGQDKAAGFAPTYGMYSVSAAINNVRLIELPLNHDFQPELPLVQQLNDPSVKLLFLCTPNNPSGNSFDTERVEEVLRTFKGIVIIDEAYIDFSQGASWLSRLAQFPHLIVMQTFSKAWGLAAARLGVAYASQEIIDLFNKVKPPYNVSRPNQEAALAALSNVEKVNDNIRIILEQRDRLIDELKQLPKVKKIYPSDANFLLVEVENANQLYEMLIERKVIVRNRHSLVRNCLRITVGSGEENQKLISALKEITL